jgi:predicted MFS family arabinose efflux permease
MAMIVVFLPRDMGLTPGEIGLFFALFGIGGVAGVLVVGPATRRLGQGPVVWISVAATSPWILLIPLAEPGWRVWLGAVAMTFVGIGGVVYNVTQVSFRQRLTPDRMLGRMNATVRFIVYGAYAVGSLLGGVLGQALGARATLWIAAAGICSAFLPVFFSPLRNLRTLPDPDPDPEPEREPVAA